MTDTPKLETLLADLKFRTTAADVPVAARESLLLLLAQEHKARRNYRIQRLLAASGMNKASIRTFDGFDWSFNPKVPRQDLELFRHSLWVEQIMNLVLIGDPGIGKTHFAKALCYEAILKGYSTCFLTAFDLISKIKKANHQDSKISYYAKTIRVLCIDELGYVFHDKNDTDLLYHVISLRSESAPTIVTSNLVPKEWGKILHGPAASAILDRLSFNGTFLPWEGPSYRLKTRRK